MKVTAETELMLNQKHADVMPPALAFDVLQTPDGDALFFSIGTDHVFYVTREVQASRTGWTRVDLSRALSSVYGNTTITAKTFALSQNPQTMGIDLALVVTVGGADHFYLSLNNSSNSDSWAKGVSWTAVPFDAASMQAPKPLTIADVYMMDIPAIDGSPAVENIFVDIIRTPGDSLQILDRYYIQPTVSPHWVSHALAIDLKAGFISSCLGNRTNDYVPGIYTFGMIGTIQELIYTPVSNPFEPNAPPIPARLTVPPGATAIASALNSSGCTNLFVAATGGLYVFTPDNQNDGATPVLAVPSIMIGTQNIFAGTSSLAVSTVGSKTEVWGVNARGDIFQVACAAGSEATASSWSAPIPLVSGVEGFAFYLNVTVKNNVLFAHISGRKMIQLTQNAVTGIWAQRNILLPPTGVNDVLEYYSYTTNVVIADDTGTGVPNTPVTLTSVSPVSVYVNNAYHILTPTAPITATSDVTGSITIIQEVQSLMAVPYHMTITGPPAVTADINPLSKVMQTLATINSGSDLGNVVVQTSTGAQKSLVPSDVSAQSKSAVAQSIVQLLKIKDTLPSGGSKGTGSGVLSLAVSTGTAATATEGPLTLWSMSTGKEGLQFYTGDDTTQLAALRSQTTLAADETSLSVIGPGAISTAFGDIIHWIQSAWDSVERFVIAEAEDAWHFIATIGGVVFDAIIDSVESIVGIIGHLFNEIKVAYEDLVAWLGFIFSWPDILRTHAVLKNIFKQYAKHAVSSIDSLETSISNGIASFEDNINAWADVTDRGEAIGVMEQRGTTAPGTNCPQANWAIYHSKNGAPDASTSLPDSSTTSSSTLDKVMADFSALAANEVGAVETAIDQVLTQVVEHISSLTAVEVMKKLVSIISDLILKTAGNVTAGALDVFKLVVSGLLDILDAPLEIPILSWLYNLITGSQLSFLDLSCLIVAIPVTIFSKTATNLAPFPDNGNTQALINAPDFVALVSLLRQPQASAAEDLVVLDEADTTAPTAEAKTLQPVDIVIGVSNMAAFPASFGYTVFNDIREASVQPSLAIRGLCAAIFLPYVAPSIQSILIKPSSGPHIWDDAMTALAVVKTMADNVALPQSEAWSRISPILDTIISIVSIGPAIWEINIPGEHNQSDGLMFAASLCGNIGGSMAVLTTENSPAPVRTAAQLANWNLTVLYGSLSLAAGDTLLTGH